MTGKLHYVLHVRIVLLLCTGLFCGAACPAQAVRIEGHSLHGLVEHGSSVEALDVACAGAIKRRDFVIFRSGAAPKPIIKQVRAVAGDHFKIEDGRILVNGEAVTTSTGRLFALSERRAQMLKLYVDSFDSLVPDETLLVLGNVAEGTTDSSQFGLVHQDDVLLVIPAATDNLRRKAGALTKEAR